MACDADAGAFQGDRVIARGIFSAGVCDQKSHQDGDSDEFVVFHRDTPLHGAYTSIARRCERPIG